MGAVYIWEENEFLYQFLIKNDGLDIFYMREEFVRTFYPLRYDVALHIAKNPHLFNNEFFATAEKERAHLFLENDYHENILKALLDYYNSFDERPERKYPLGETLENLDPYMVKAIVTQKYSNKLKPKIVKYAKGLKEINSPYYKELKTFINTRC